jgi:lipopolysaccharide transport protein LptA
LRIAPGLLVALGVTAATAAGPGLPPFGLGDFDRAEPIAITADQLEARDDGGRRTLAFRRNVEVRQGPLHLSSSVLSALYVEGEEQPRRLEARGNVRIREGVRRAACDGAVYERAAQRIVCRGEPARLWDGDDLLAGREIHFDLARRSVRVEGAPRVEIHRELAEAGLDELGELAGEELGERLRDGGPVTIDAARLEASDEGGARSIHFEGDVVFRQGEIALRADDLVALYPVGSARPERLIATGDVVLVEAEREAHCAHAEYTLEERRITCEGDAVLRDGGDRLEGDRIAFDFRSRQVDATGRTRLFVQPRPRRGGAPQ